MKRLSIQLRDSVKMRWLVLLLVSFTMFTAYVASDVLAPLETMLFENNHWGERNTGYSLVLTQSLM